MVTAGPPGLDVLGRVYVVTKLFYMAGTEMLESNVIKQPDTMKAYDVY